MWVLIAMDQDNFANSDGGFMKKLIFALTVLFISTFAFSQAVTPNLQLTLPAHGAPNWDTQMNGNFSIIDSTVGSLLLPFKGTWSNSITYSQGQQVSFAGALYISVVNGNLNHQPNISPSQWNLMVATALIGNPQGTATISTNFNSFNKVFQGSYFDGSLAQTNNWEFSVTTTPTSGSTINSRMNWVPSFSGACAGCTSDFAIGGSGSLPTVGNYPTAPWWDFPNLTDGFTSSFKHTLTANRTTTVPDLDQTVTGAVNTVPAAVSGNGTAGVNSQPLQSGVGGATTGTTGQTAGAGGLLLIQAGQGGTAPLGSTLGTGGAVTISSGLPGSGAGTAAIGGAFQLQFAGQNFLSAAGSGNVQLTSPLAGGQTTIIGKLATTTWLGVCCTGPGVSTVDAANDSNGGPVMLVQSSTGSVAGTAANSGVFQINGGNQNAGTGITPAGTVFYVQGGNGSNNTGGGNGGNGGGSTILEGAGGTGGTTNPGGTGGGTTITAGAGGANSNSGGTGGVGGATSITSGPGGANSGGGTSGTGGAMTVSSGAGGASSGAGIVSANGGVLTLSSGAGGPNNGSSGAGVGGNGGNINMLAGNGGIGTPAGIGGAGGTVTISAGTSGAVTTGGPTAIGGALNLNAGAGGAVTSGSAGAGGITTVQGGAGGASTAAGTTGTGGALLLNGGTGGNGSTFGGQGGAVTITGGLPGGSSSGGIPGLSGAVSINTPTPASSNSTSSGSGQISIGTGAGGACTNSCPGSASGGVTISTGNGGVGSAGNNGGSPGSISLTAGNGVGAGNGSNGGGVILGAGNGGSGTVANGNGGSVLISAGALGTGAGTAGSPGNIQISAGTVTSTAVPLRVIINDTRALTSGSATTLLSIPLATTQMAGGNVQFYLEATDGTNQCTLSGIVYYSAENSAGTFVTNTSVAGTSATACTATKTLTATFAVTSANPALLQVTPTLTGITATRFTAVYEVHHMGITNPTP